MKNFEQYKKTIRFATVSVFGLVATLIYYFIWNAIYNTREVLEHRFFSKGQLFIVVLYFVVLLIAEHFLGSARIDELRKGEIIFSSVLALLFTNAIAYAQICLVTAKLANPLGFLYILLAQTAFLCLWAYASFTVVHSLNPPEEMLIIFGSHQATEIVYKMSKIQERYVIKESISVDEGSSAIIERINHYKSIVICDVPARLRNDLLKYCYENDKIIYVVPKISDILLCSATDVTYFDSPLLKCGSEGLTVEQRLLKRIFDVCFSGLALLVLSPLFLIVALCIKCYDRGPVFFKQKRYTRDMRLFDILKFRSMVVDAEKNGPQPAVKHDSRITPIGRVIRATRIDELPQLINILKGDMSVVGPRPERVEYVEKYSEAIPEFHMRYKVKGGLTGYAQVYGKYNTKPYDKLKMDLIYIQNYSIALDLKLMLMTIRIMFSLESTEGFKEKKEPGK